LAQDPPNSSTTALESLCRDVTLLAENADGYGYPTFAD